MKRRLFWKILIGFFITFIAIIQGLWLLFTFYEAPNPHEMQVAEKATQLRLAEAGNALKQGGKNAVNEMVAYWPPAERDKLRLEPISDENQQNKYLLDQYNHVLLLTTYVRGSDQQLYRLSYPIRDADFIKEPRGPLFIPIQLLVLGIIGGFLFSAGLAWYVAQPIHHLKWGFDQLTKGNLDVRLQKTMGKRHDELADLARDFDQMAAHINHLISSRNQLLHDVSHELRSPLARLNVAIALLRQNPARMQEIFERIESESHRLDQMVNELLTLSRVESGAPELDNYLDINNLIYAVTEDAKFEASTTDVIIQSNVTHIDDTKEVSNIIKGNGQLLRRALENVIRNAIHHSTSGKSVEVNLFSDTLMQCYIISISDRGSGVEEEKLSSIFDPFVRVHPNNSGEGFGLGLAIAYRAVLAHGGTIKAENRRGGGLIVTIRLPFDTSKPIIP